MHAFSATFSAQLTFLTVVIFVVKSLSISTIEWDPKAFRVECNLTQSVHMKREHSKQRWDTSLLWVHISQAKLVFPELIRNIFMTNSLVLSVYKLVLPFRKQI